MLGVKYDELARQANHQVSDEIERILVRAIASGYRGCIDVRMDSHRDPPNAGLNPTSFSLVVTCKYVERDSLPTWERGCFRYDIGKAVEFASKS